MEIFMAPHLAGRTAAGLHLVYYESDPILKNKGEFKLETSTNFTSAEWQYLHEFRLSLHLARSRGACLLLGLGRTHPNSTTTKTAQFVRNHIYYQAKSLKGEI